MADMGAKLVNGKHEATPRTEIHVNGGEIVNWKAGSELIKFNESPFDDDKLGPFAPGSTSTVKRGLSRGKSFPCVGGTNGQIIVDNP